MVWPEVLFADRKIVRRVYRGKMRLPKSPESSRLRHHEPPRPESAVGAGSSVPATVGLVLRLRINRSRYTASVASATRTDGSNKAL